MEEGASDAATQLTKIKFGLQDSYDPLQTLGATMAGATVGAITGGVSEGIKGAKDTQLGRKIGLLGSKGGSSANGIVNGKTPAARLADKFRGLSNSKRPNTIAAVRTRDGRYYIGRNRGGVINDTINNMLNQL